MRRFYPFVLTALLLFVSSSVSAQGPALTITDGSNSGRPVFPADVPLVRAFANFTATAKVRAELKWTAPSGRLHSTTFKTLFPNKSGGPGARPQRPRGEGCDRDSDTGQRRRGAHGRDGGALGPSRRLALRDACGRAGRPVSRRAGGGAQIS